MDKSTLEYFKQGIMDFEQVQSDLAKFKSYTPMLEDDVIALMKYIGRFEQLIQKKIILSMDT